MENQSRKDARMQGFFGFFFNLQVSITFTKSRKRDENETCLLDCHINGFHDDDDEHIHINNVGQEGRRIL
tara:strand:- start:4726 stop:4935 length:210 start_codon:yes stop_codon:yes gene_type:complete